MKLRPKTVLAIVAICSCLSMFCIGFANWSYSAVGTASGTISAEEVTSYIEFVSVSGLEYGPSGFVTQDDNVSYEGTLTVTYRFYRGRIYKKLGKATASVSIELKYAEPTTPVSNNIFDKSTNFVTAEVKSGSENFDSNVDVNGEACIITFNLNLSGSESDSYTNIETVFHFNMDETTYKTYISGDGTKKFPGFMFRATIAEDGQ